MAFMLTHSFRLGKIFEAFDLFCLESLTRSLRSAYITEYSGVLLDSDEARVLPRDSQSWLRTLSSQFYEIDGNPSLFAEGHIEMARRHILGSLCNHSDRRQNCLFEIKEWYSKELRSTSQQAFMKCTFIRATRDIYPHEQLLVSYGATADSFQHIPF